MVFRWLLMVVDTVVDVPLVFANSLWSLQMYLLFRNSWMKNGFIWKLANSLLIIGGFSSMCRIVGVRLLNDLSHMPGTYVNQLKSPRHGNNRISVRMHNSVLGGRTINLLACSRFSYACHNPLILARGDPWSLPLSCHPLKGIILSISTLLISWEGYYIVLLISREMVNGMMKRVFSSENGLLSRIQMSWYTRGRSVKRGNTITHTYVGSTNLPELTVTNGSKGAE